MYNIYVIALSERRGSLPCEEEGRVIGGVAGCRLPRLPRQIGLLRDALLGRVDAQVHGEGGAPLRAGCESLLGCCLLGGAVSQLRCGDTQKSLRLLVVELHVAVARGVRYLQHEHETHLCGPLPACSGSAGACCEEVACAPGPEVINAHLHAVLSKCWARSHELQRRDGSCCCLDLGWATPRRVFLEGHDGQSLQVGSGHPGGVLAVRAELADVRVRVHSGLHAGWCWCCRLALLG
mmetsp:Transcript_22827/g.51220  ORF Transcript_22827/g.51220 Transcript_22827/m.51220 type:complete len:236 (-) Transcript_22827:1541-2248(-)